MKTHKFVRTAGIAGLVHVLAANPVLASATDGNVPVSTASLIAELAVFIGVVICLFIVFKLYVSLRGGKIAYSWRWFVGGFAMLALAQVALFTGQAGLLQIMDLWVSLIRIGAIVLFLIGAVRMRKLLT